MPLDMRTGDFICPACDGRYGLLDRSASPASAPAEFVCADCPSADQPATTTSMTASDGHRHSAIDPREVDAFYGRVAAAVAQGKGPEQAAPPPDQTVAATDAIGEGQEERAEQAEQDAKRRGKG